MEWGSSHLSAHPFRRTSGLLCIVALVFKTLARVDGCYIQGTDSGICDSDLYDDIDVREANMPFCYKYVDYIPCVPQEKTLDPSRDYPSGRWYNYTVLTKDNWIEKQYNSILKWRLYEESSDPPRVKKGYDEWGNKGTTTVRFTKNDDCQAAYAAYFCWINFPRCDEQDESLMTCRSACENLMQACGYVKDMWRCGKSEYFNYGGSFNLDESHPEKAASQTAEEEEETGGLPIYYRDYFPGQPFRDYEAKSDVRNLHNIFPRPKHPKPFKMGALLIIIL